MPTQELAELKQTDSEMLLNLIISCGELEPAKKELSKHTDEVKALAQGNIQLDS
jgi:hypothetical protein